MKKIIIAALAVLVFIFILTLVFTSLRARQNPGANTTQPTPTTAPFNYSGSVSLTSTPVDPAIVEAAKNLTPYETEGFRYEYSEQLNKMVLTEKTETGYHEFLQWIDQNGLLEVANNPDLIEIREYPSTGPGTGEKGIAPTRTEYDKTVKPLVDFLNILMNFSQGADTSVTPTPIPLPTSGEPQSSSEPSQSRNTTATSSRPNASSKLVYYAQCNGYGNTPLPSGCDLCEAGCGPTTVAMIAASYLGDKYNPKTIVDLYEKNGYYLSCAGSRYTDAKAALEGLGLKTTSYLVYDLEKSDSVVSDFKKYIDGGWTMFTLANYCDKGCGHFFWVTDVKDGEILAYDPYYGKSSTPPYNENSRYPFPKYRVAFGVKK